jgi:hypothetical protein
MHAQTVGVTKTAAIAGVTIVLMVVGAIALAQDKLSSSKDKPQNDRCLFVFFTPTDALQLDAELVRALSKSGLRVVPQLLLDDHACLTPNGAPSETLIDSLKSLQQVLGEGGVDLAVMNVEGLALAKRYGIDRTPAWVFAPDSSHAHVTYGSSPDLKELTQCTR